MQLITYLKDTFRLSDDLLLQIEKVCSTKMFNKRDVILSPAHYSKHIFFIEKGLARIFYEKTDKKITHYFCPENTFAAGSESVFYNKLSQYGIEAIEQSEVTIIPFSVIEKLADESLAINKLVQQILLDALIGFSSRLHSMQFETAQERYQKFLETNPEMLLRAPLGDIASYLGISQQTLSVIRAGK
jgi:CRP-like cAMP-binding protein